MEDGSTHAFPEFPYSTLVAFERAYGVSVKKLMEEERAEWLAFCAWNTLRKSKQIPDSTTVEQFIEALNRLEVDQDADVEEESGKDLASTLG